MSQLHVVKKTKTINGKDYTALSGPYSDNCVNFCEVAGGVEIADDAGNTLTFTRDEWEHLVAGIKQGLLD